MEGNSAQNSFQNRDLHFIKFNLLGIKNLKFFFCHNHHLGTFNVITSHHSKAIPSSSQKNHDTFFHTAFHTISHCWQLGNVFLKWDRRWELLNFVIYTTKRKRRGRLKRAELADFNGNLNNFQHNLNQHRSLTTEKKL